MEPLKHKKNEEKVLNDKSLKNRAKAAYDKNKIKWTLNIIFKLLLDVRHNYVYSAHVISISPSCRDSGRSI